LCRSDHGITWAEFEDLTLAQLEALEERRAVRVRHSRFNSALVASILANTNRSGDSEAVSPFDFLAGFEESDEEIGKRKLRESTKAAIRVFVANTSPDGVKESLRRMVEKMKDGGEIDDPEELVREVFPGMEF
jgi:hypothetical protein